MKLRPVKLQEQRRIASAGGESLISGGAYDSDKGRTFILFFAHAEKRAFGFGALMSSSAEKFQGYTQQVTAFLASLRLSDQAAAMAVNNAAEARKTATAPAQPKVGAKVGAKAGAMAGAKAPAAQAANPPAGNSRFKSQAEAMDWFRHRPSYTGVGVGGMTHGY